MERERVAFKMINRVLIVGNLTKDAEVRRTQSGSVVVRFSIANNERRKVNGEWADAVNYVDCVMFGTRAEKLADSLRKGVKLAVDGKLRWSQYDTDSGRRTKLEVVVDDLDFMSGKAKQPDVYADDCPF